MSKKKKSKKSKKTNTPQTAKAIIFNDKGEILILKTVSKHGRWDLPGGNREPKDKTNESCADREVKQETGLKVRKYRQLGAWKIQNKLRHLYVASAKHGKVKLDITEHNDHKWVKPKDLKDFDLKKKVISLCSAYQREVKKSKGKISKKRHPRAAIVSRMKLAA